MKKVTLILLSSLSLFGNIHLNAQWLVGGNNLAANGSFGANTNFSVIFETNNTERGRLTNTGLWGFGTNAPNSRVHINSAAGENPFRVQVAGTTRFLVNSAGNIGVGALAPAVKLHVDGGADAGPAGGGFIISGSTSGANVVIDENEIMARNNGAASDLFLNHNGSNLIINGTNAAGHVGIGTTAPGNRLHVRQNVANRAIQWQHESNNNFWTVGIGTNTQNCAFLFNNVFKATISSVDGSYTTFSDARLKEDVEPVGQLLDKIMQLKPSTYYFKDSRSIAKKKSIGFIAQDVEKVFPELVHDGDDGYKSLNYTGLTVMAIKALQEQQSIIEGKDNELNELKSQVNKLQSQLEQIQNLLIKKGLTSGSEWNGQSATKAYLQSNAPNPFNQKTTIRYHLPDDAANAMLQIVAVNGTVVKSIQLTQKGNGQLVLQGNEFTAGVYSYVLLINGRKVDSKQMILTR